MADASKAVPKVLKYEGVYDNDPADSGGETVYGITRTYQPNWAGWKRVDEIKASEMGSLPALLQGDHQLMGYVEAYYSAMWDRFFLSRFQHQALAESVFNACINQGPERSLKWLQYCSNALSANAVDIKEDGVMGEGSALQICNLIDNGKGDLLLELFKAQRIAAYTVTAHNRESSLKYIQGWLNRVNQGG